MAEATSATEKDVAEGKSYAPSPGDPGADSPQTEAQQAEEERQANETPATTSE